MRKKNLQFWISHRWFEISTPNFHQLLTLIGTRFAPKMKALGASDLDFLPKTFKTSNGRSRPSFEATPFKFGENSFFAWLQICWNFGGATSKGLKLVKSVWECSVHTLRSPCLIQGCTLILDSRVGMSCIPGKEVWDKMHKELRCSSHRYCPFAWSKAGCLTENCLFLKSIIFVRTVLWDCGPTSKTNITNISQKI